MPLFTDLIFCTRAQLQLVRAIGVAVVVHGSMFSNMELLLRHAIQYLGLKGDKIRVVV